MSASVPVLMRRYIYRYRYCYRNRCLDVCVILFSSSGSSSVCVVSVRVSITLSHLSHLSYLSHLSLSLSLYAHTHMHIIFILLTSAICLLRTYVSCVHMPRVHNDTITRCAIARACARVRARCSSCGGAQAFRSAKVLFGLRLRMHSCATRGCSLG